MESFRKALQRITNDATAREERNRYDLESYWQSKCLTAADNRDYCCRITVEESEVPNFEEWIDRNNLSVLSVEIIHISTHFKYEYLIDWLEE
jgi:hypothetical protein